MSLLGSYLSYETRSGSLQLLRQVSQLKMEESGRRGSEKVTHMQKAQPHMFLLLLQLLLVFDAGQCVSDFGVYGPLLLDWKRTENVKVKVYRRVPGILFARWIGGKICLVPAAGVGERRELFGTSGVGFEMA